MQHSTVLPSQRGRCHMHGHAKPLLLTWPAWTTLWTMLFSNDNNVVTALFSHHCCNNLLTSWNKHVKNDEYYCSINKNIPRFQQPWTTLLLHHLSTILLKQCSTILLVQQCCSRMITVLLKQCSGNKHWSIYNWIAHPATKVKPPEWRIGSTKMTATVVAKC